MKSALYSIIIISMLTGIGPTYAKSIRLHGSLVNQTPPSKHVQDARVFLRACGNTLEAAYSNKEGTYEKRLVSAKYAKEKVIFLVQHDNYVQTNPDNDVIKTEESGASEHHINVKTKRHLANTLVLSAKQSASSGDYAKALDQLDSASSIYQSFDIYSYKVRLVGDALKTNIALPVRHANLSSDVEFMRFSRSLSDIDRYKLFLQLGHIYTNVPDPEKNIDDTTTYMDVATEAYTEAKIANPINAKPYQGQYKLYEKTRNYYDAALVIQEYFDKNPTVSRVSTARTFILDWLTNYEKVTGFPYASKEEISKQDFYIAMAKKILKAIDHHEAMFKNDDKPESKRIMDAAKVLKKIIEEE